MSFKHPLLGDLDRQTAVDVDMVRAQTFDVMQFKYDGIWGAVSRFDSNSGVVTSRNGLVKDAINDLVLPDKTRETLPVSLCRSKGPAPHSRSPTSPHRQLLLRYSSRAHHPRSQEEPYLRRYRLSQLESKLL